MAFKLLALESDPFTYQLRVRIPNSLNLQGMAGDGVYFELRCTDVSAEERPSYTWPLLQMNADRYLVLPGSSCPGKPQDPAQDRTLLCPATALPWLAGDDAGKYVEARIQNVGSIHSCMALLPNARVI